MKALSLKQPWADLIVQGKKIIETRKWRTNFRGEFYIHASKSFDKKNCESFGIKNPVTGALIGKVELVNVKEYKNKKEFDEDYRKHFAKNFVRFFNIVDKSIKVFYGIEQKSLPSKKIILQPDERNMPEYLATCSYCKNDYLTNQTLACPSCGASKPIFITRK